MKHDEKWNSHYTEILAFILNNKRRPSKHRPEDRLMLNWLKYNKRRLRRGLMAEDRVAMFKHLLAVADKYRRLNQSTYALKNINDEEPPIF